MKSQQLKIDKMKELRKLVEKFEITRSVKSRVFVLHQIRSCVGYELRKHWQLNKKGRRVVK